ncbi:MAG: type II toxin-antitoxin system Phd/YefM family antitoxin [Patescibacteria group bacterium]
MTNKTISTTEARGRISEITDEVEQKKVTYSFTRHGKVVAKLVPADFSSSGISPRLAQELKEFLAEHGEAMARLAKR